ncbi:MAG: rod shape-determining protein MreC [Gammaproteobacteria bacterium]
MAFGVANQSLPGRGPTPGLRFVAYAVLSITLMFLDRREGWMEQVRFGLQTAMYPLQMAVSSPGAAWGWVRESARTRETLRSENTELRTRLRDLELRTMRYEAVSQENAQLRGLRTALPPVAEKWLVAEIVHVEIDSLRPSRVLINRGTSNGVFKGQAVMDDDGILGQTKHVGPWSAEVILITDPAHEIPVQIERTGVRTIALGNEDSLGLPFLPANADIKAGDVLLTSGMGGVFPQGYPVAKVASINREAVKAVERVRAEPLAQINRSREVMLVWFREAHPAAPVRNAESDLPKGDPNAQAQPTPPKPKPAAGEATPGTGTTATPGAAAGTQRAGTATPPATRPSAGPRNTIPTPAPASGNNAAPLPPRASGAPPPGSAASPPPRSNATPAPGPAAAPRTGTGTAAPATPSQPTTPPAGNRE